jgi:hypothetical protein
MPDVFFDGEFLRRRQSNSNPMCRSQRGYGERCVTKEVDRWIRQLIDSIDYVLFDRQQQQQIRETLRDDIAANVLACYVWIKDIVIKTLILGGVCGKCDHYTFACECQVCFVEQKRNNVLNDCFFVFYGYFLCVVSWCVAFSW